MLYHIHNNNYHSADDVGLKQWVKSWGMYRWAGKACIWVRKVCHN